MRIKANTLVTRNHMELKPHGIEYRETAAFGGYRFFGFDQIEAVLRAPHLLAFQAGTETFSIPIDPNNAEHRTFAARLVSEAKRTVRRS